MSVPPDLQPPEPRGRGQRVLGAKGEATRQRLMAAAEEIFGTRGYHAASISDITRRAGVAQGTFYLYFDSKLEIFRALVQEISHNLRRATTAAIAGVTDRREAEMRGFQVFFAFLQQHRNIYKVVRECEFVDEELFRWYYQRMAEGYRRRLAEAQERGQVRPLDPETLAWCFMGVAHMLGIRYVLWDEPGAVDRVFPDVMAFLAHGFAPAPRDPGHEFMEQRGKDA